MLYGHTLIKLLKSKCQATIRYLSEKRTGSTVTIFYLLRAMWRFTPS